MKEAKLGIWNAECLYIHRNLPNMEKPLPESHSFARGKINNLRKLSKLPGFCSGGKSYGI